MLPLVSLQTLNSNEYITVSTTASDVKTSNGAVARGLGPVHTSKLSAVENRIRRNVYNISTRQEKEARLQLEFPLVDDHIERIFEQLGVQHADGQEMELCKKVTDFVKIFSVSKPSILGDIENQNSRLWFDLLHRIGWLKGIIETKDIDDENEALREQKTQAWNTSTGLSWKEWFLLLCKLQNMKRKMIKNSTDEPNRRQILSTYGSGPDTNQMMIDAGVMKKGTPNEQWKKVQERVLILYNALPPIGTVVQEDNIYTDFDEARVSNAGRGALFIYMAIFYDSVRHIAAGQSADHVRTFIKADKVFMQFLLDRDVTNYKYFLPSFKTQELSDKLSSNVNALDVIPEEYRNSKAYVIGAFKGDNMP